MIVTSDFTPRLIFSIGDVNGIGLEVLYKGLKKTLPTGQHSAMIVGEAGTINSHLRENPVEGLSIEGASLRVGEIAVPIESVEYSATVRPGEIAEDSGRLAAESIVRSVELLLEKRADGLITLPISKEAIHRAGYDYPGHTELIAEKSGSTRALMILFCKALRVAMLTGHHPLGRVANLITRSLILETLETLNESLRHDFGIERPRIAILGVNPHAGDGGALGHEEVTIYKEALAQTRKASILCEGPFSADAFFARGSYRDYDGVVASYHDQGLIPMKMLARDDGVNFTAGLPIVRTSPDHGTAFDIAGKGLASEASLVSAIEAAIAIIGNRRGLPGGLPV